MQLLSGRRSAMDDWRIERLDRSHERAGNDDVPRYTFSGGVAEYPTDGDEATALLGRADDRLYAAKEAGRNRIFLLDAAAAG